MQVPMLETFQGFSEQNLPLPLWEGLFNNAGCWAHPVGLIQKVSVRV